MGAGVMAQIENGGNEHGIAKPDVLKNQAVADPVRPDIYKYQSAHRPLQEANPPSSPV